jgi:hypothetical protein
MRWLSVILLFACLSRPAWANDTSLNANVSPPRQLAPDEATSIRMAQEHISLHFGKGRSRVEVEFTFENLADVEAACLAGFPDEDLLARYTYSEIAREIDAAEKGSSPPANTYPISDGINLTAGEDMNDDSVLQDFTAWTRSPDAGAERHEPLDTALVRIERIAYEPAALDHLDHDWSRDDFSEVNQLMFCHTFKLHLAAHQRLVVGHSYSTLNGMNVLQQRLFSYTLGTGRSWAGTIGQATIDCYLEDGLSVKDLYFGTEGAQTNPPLKQFSRLSPQHLQVVWTDFEPRDERSYILLATKPQAYPEQAQ